MWVVYEQSTLEFLLKQQTVWKCKNSKWEYNEFCENQMNKFQYLFYLKFSLHTIYYFRVVHSQTRTKYGKKWIENKIF